jgi:hypothetical protein
MSVRNKNSPRCADLSARASNGRLKRQYLGLFWDKPPHLCIGVGINSWFTPLEISENKLYYEQC